MLKTVILVTNSQSECHRLCRTTITTTTTNTRLVPTQRRWSRIEKNRAFKKGEELQVVGGAMVQGNSTLNVDLELLDQRSLAYIYVLQR